MRPFYAIFAVLLIASCASSNPKEKTTYPMKQEDARKIRNGSLTGTEEGGIRLFGDKKDDDSKKSGIGVNSFLWRASLDTISFMPVSQADPFGGVILTDWYEDPAAKGERFKVNVTILDDRLRADGVRVSLFKQKFDAKAGWRDEIVAKESEREIENTILTRARELRVKQTGK